LSDHPTSAPAPARAGAQKLIIAFGLLAIAPLGFWAVVRTPGEHFMLLQLAATLPIVIALSILISEFKLRQTPLWNYCLVFCALFFLFMAAGSAFLALHIQREDQEFDAHATPGVAVITKTFIAPNGVTHRINIEIQGQDGKTGHNNIEIEPALWKTMKPGDPFPVNYVPQNPDNNRPVLTGLPPNPRGSPLVMVIASIFGVVGFIASAWSTIRSFKTAKA
jgi:hypothetical protein